MNSKKAWAILTTCLLATGCATTQDAAQPSATPAEAPTMLTGDEIKSLISGRTAEGRNSDDYDFKLYHSPDGKVSATAAKGGKTYSSAGTWEIQGNTVCSKWLIRIGKQRVFQSQKMAKAMRSSLLRPAVLRRLPRSKLMGIRTISKLGP